MWLLTIHFISVMTIDFTVLNTVGVKGAACVLSFWQCAMLVRVQLLQGSHGCVVQLGLLELALMLHRVIL